MTDGHETPGRRRQDARRHRNTVWHRAVRGGGAADGGDGSPGGDANTTRRSGGLGRSHHTAAERARHAERTIVHGLVASGIVVLVVLMITVVWPRVSFLWSGVRTVVDTLSTSAVYVGPGATAAGAGEIAGIVGTRPVAVVVLGKNDPLADDALGTCEAVVGRLPDLIVQVIVDGRFDNGCEGTDVRLGSGQTWDSWDFAFWQEQYYATTLIGGDIPEQTRQLALAYDAEVKGGRLVGAERHFRPPPNRGLVAAGIAGGVVAGTVLAFVLLRLATRWGFAAADRRRDWEHRHDEIDGQLGDVALVMVSVQPDRRSDRELATAVGAVAGDYRRALDALTAARPGDDLTALQHQVQDIRRRLRAAGAPA